MGRHHIRNRNWHRKHFGTQVLIGLRISQNFIRQNKRHSWQWKWNPSSQFQKRRCSALKVSYKPNNSCDSDVSMRCPLKLFSNIKNSTFIRVLKTLSQSSPEQELLDDIGTECRAFERKLFGSDGEAPTEKSGLILPTHLSTTRSHTYEMRLSRCFKQMDSNQAYIELRM